MVMGLGILGMIAVKELRAASLSIIAADTVEEKESGADARSGLCV